MESHNPTRTQLRETTEISTTVVCMFATGGVYPTALNTCPVLFPLTRQERLIVSFLLIDDEHKSH